MTDPVDDDGPAGEDVPADENVAAGAAPTEAGRAEAARAEAARRQRRAEVFGDVLPDTTRDEHDDPASGHTTSGGHGSSACDEELRRDVPPHHGS